MAIWGLAVKTGQVQHNLLVMSMELDKPVIIPSSLLAVSVQMGQLVAAQSQPLEERQTLALYSLQVSLLGLAVVPRLNPQVAPIPREQVFLAMAALHTPAAPTTLPCLIHRLRA